MIRKFSNYFCWNSIKFVCKIDEFSRFHSNKMIIIMHFHPSILRLVRLHSFHFLIHTPLLRQSLRLMLKRARPRLMGLLVPMGHSPHSIRWEIWPFSMPLQASHSSKVLWYLGTNPWFNLSVWVSTGHWLSSLPQAVYIWLHRFLLHDRIAS